jgi:multiple sugar transport system permease protein
VIAARGNRSRPLRRRDRIHRAGGGSTAGETLRAAPWILPALLVIGAALLYPSVKAIQYSFTSRTTFLPGGWVGLDNFASLLADDLFWKSLRNNLILLLSVPLTIVIALVVTGALYRAVRGTKLYELCVFLPFLPAVASISAIFIYLLGFNGPINTALRGVGADEAARAWFADPSTAIWAVLGVAMWKRLGFTVLLFSARMASLDRSLLEAAAVDGASWRLTYWSVAVPQLRSIISFAAVLGFIEVFSWTFAYIFVLTRGGPDRATYTLEYLLYDTQFNQQLVGLASAVAVVLLLLASVVAVYRVRAARRELPA